MIFAALRNGLMSREVGKGTKKDEVDGELRRYKTIRIGKCRCNSK
jgi:hypothetical protein